MMEIGGTPEGVIAASAIKCLGGATRADFGRETTRSDRAGRRRPRSRDRAHYRRPRARRGRVRRRHRCDERRAAEQRPLHARRSAHRLDRHALTLRHVRRIEAEHAFEKLEHHRPRVPLPRFRRSLRTFGDVTAHAPPRCARRAKPGFADRAAGPTARLRNPTGSSLPRTASSAQSRALPAGLPRTRRMQEPSLKSQDFQRLHRGRLHVRCVGPSGLRCSSSPGGRRRAGRPRRLPSPPRRP